MTGGGVFAAGSAWRRLLVRPPSPPVCARLTAPRRAAGCQLSDKQLDDLTDVVEEQSAVAGTALADAGQPVHAALMVIQGSVRVLASAEGGGQGQQVLTVGAGEWLGAAALLHVAAAAGGGAGAQGYEQCWSGDLECAGACACVQRRRTRV